MSNDPRLPAPVLWSLIIFDCDGVLVDSEPITNRIFRRMLNEIGLEISLEETMSVFLGRTMDDCVGIIEDRLGHAVPDNFIEQYHRRIIPAFERELKAVPGVETVLDAIPGPTCVASSGAHEKMRATLGVTGLLSRFEGRLFSATEVPRGKPFPDLFLHAAKTFGAEPSRCAVIEDSVPGVQAGRAAGMHVFGYAGFTPSARLEQAGALVFHHMRELPVLLEEHGRRLLL
ncbi:MAG: HAD family hydrolase [candidate division Zixibacteria bacterium]|jgi:HAD superfamily hydrolase (TIGR01509 family)|nr:HAD family hydrolase [candidate division Zixibacteria bacterium]